MIRTAAETDRFAANGINSAIRVISTLRKSTRYVYTYHHMQQYTLILLFAVSCALAPACKPKSTEAVPTAVPDDASAALPGGFQEFYTQFHADSMYQVAHISWPLQGAEGIQKDSTRTGIQTKYWQPAEWRFQRLDAMAPGDFDRTINTLGEGMVIEKISAKAVPFGVERRFARKPDGQWELIYYADVHEFKK
jgi:hypothetical protein